VIRNFAFHQSKKEVKLKMTTGKKAASDAGKILRDPKSTKKEKEVAASDLAQRREPSKVKGKGK
jgi:hypothetical protein